MDNFVFSERLKKARKALGLRQKDLAQVVGVSVDSIHRWEKAVRDPKLGDLKNLADSLNVSVKYLTGEEEDISPQLKVTDKTDDSRQQNDVCPTPIKEDDCVASQEKSRFHFEYEGPSGGKLILDIPGDVSPEEMQRYIAAVITQMPWYEHEKQHLNPDGSEPVLKPASGGEFSE